MSDSTLEKRIRDRISEYKGTPKQIYVATKGPDRAKWDFVFRTIHKHFQTILLPQIQANKEHFIEYWPTFFLWGYKSEYKRGAFDNRTYLYKSGTYGTGYLCVSDKNVYITTFNRATREISPYAGGVSRFLLKVADGMAGERDHLQPVQDDKLRSIDYGSIIAAEILDNDLGIESLYIKTVLEKYEVQCGIEGLQDIRDVISFGISGKMKNLSNPSLEGQISSNSVPASQEILNLLAKLAELRDTGVINDVEFETKKKDLLSRL